jgi:hypothetical protein
LCGENTPLGRELSSSAILAKYAQVDQEFQLKLRLDKVDAIQKTRLYQRQVRGMKYVASEWKHAFITPAPDIELAQ